MNKGTSDKNRLGNSERFLAAFADIERVLRYKTAVGERAPFSSALKVIKRKGHPLHCFHSDLMKFKELRNAMVHEAHDGVLIAEPSDWAVSEIEKIRSVLNRPPKAMEFGSEAVTCDPACPVSEVVSMMTEHSFSQVPVRLASGSLRLLTTDTISRWLGASLASGKVSYTTPVKIVLEYTENPRNFDVVSEEDTVFEVLAKFSRKITAILITPSGTKREPPLRIITVWDLPEVQAAADWHMHLNPIQKQRKTAGGI